MPKTINQYDPRSVGNAGQMGWSASGQSSLIIGAKAFVLSGLDLGIEVDHYDTSPVVVQDYFMRMIQSISLIGDGKNFLMINGPDARSLYWHHRLRTQGRDRVVDYEAGGSSGTPNHSRFNLPILLTPHPVKFDDQPNFFGLKAGIITSDDLTLAINWNTAGIWGTGSSITIKNAYITVNYLGYVPGSDAEKPNLYPMWVSQNFVPPSAQPGLGYLMPIPTGNWWYRRTSLMFLSGVAPNDVRTNGLSSLNAANVAVSEIGYQTADGRNPIKLKVADLAAQSQTQFNVADDNTGNGAGTTVVYGKATIAQHVNPGVGMIDWAQSADLSDKANASTDFGINAAGKDSTSLQIAATVDVAANTSINLLHERYAPY